MSKRVGATAVIEIRYKYSTFWVESYLKLVADPYASRLKTVTESFLNSVSWSYGRYFSKRSQITFSNQSQASLKSVTITSQNDHRFPPQIIHIQFSRQLHTASSNQSVSRHEFSLQSSGRMYALFSSLHPL